MTYRVMLQPQAERDIQTAARWMLGRSGSSRAALKWVRSLRAKLQTLGTLPHRCPIDPDSEFYGEEVRVLPHGKRGGVYPVLFTIRGETVHILSVRHSSQQGLSEQMADDEEDEMGP